MLHFVYQAQELKTVNGKFNQIENLIPEGDLTHSCIKEIIGRWKFLKGLLFDGGLSLHLCGFFGVLFSR